MREGQWPVNFGAAASHEFHRMRVLDGMPIERALATATTSPPSAIESYEENDTPDWAVTTAMSLDQMNAMFASHRRGTARRCSRHRLHHRLHGERCDHTRAVQPAEGPRRTTAASTRRTSGYWATRQPPTEATLGAWEQIANGVALNQPLLLSHNNNFGLVGRSRSICSCCATRATTSGPSTTPTPAGHRRSVRSS